VCVVADASTPPECTVNADCKRFEDGSAAPAICLKASKRCAPLLSPECPKVVGAVADDDTILLGSIFSLKGTNATGGQARENSVEAALSDITRDIVGLPATTMGGKPRPLAVLSCTDNDGTKDVGDVAAAHLRDVGVTAVIGPGSSGLVTTVSGNVTAPAGMFLITPSATSTSLSGRPLVWRTAPSDVVQAIAISASVPELETKYRSDNLIPVQTAIKLAVVYKDDPYGAGLFTAIGPTLAVNGKLVTDPMNAVNFKGVKFATTATPADYQAIVADLASTFHPNLVLLFGTAEVVTQILQPLEAAWPVMGFKRPAYLVSDGGRKPELLTACQGNDPLRLRIRGTVPGTNNALFQSFKLGYQSKYPGAYPDVFGMAGAYDSVYLLALTITSLGQTPISGAGIEAAMAKTVGGTTKFAFGKDKTQDAIAAIASGKGLDVDGASGPLDFDLKAHEAPSDIDVWCVANINMTATYQSSGRYYDANAKGMTGIFNCN
jgi:branched-chain amino acid transport system substrate-binding protein